MYVGVAYIKGTDSTDVDSDPNKQKESEEDYTEITGKTPSTARLTQYQHRRNNNNNNDNNKN